ncbi:amino acid ABC transporter substrate-binding protein [Variovorax sp. J22R133]|uniref:amino acid ABC transporter substrate-binding protein n=1 Tax=Variovorax brevis TaxID=3053503 RepID=UPI002578CE68|nr:amino acid ABC transporter substrate-binding protein [Variovorax sp. J22R133]MDM0114414.1 amino acid ABC transporter substrate-binding protein [Variovorax sp. J22R133]
MNGFAKAFGPLARVMALLGAALLLASSSAHAQVGGLTGTLAKVRASGTITLGYRESSIPFSYLSTRNEPIGYSIELCHALVSAIEDAVNKSLAVKWVPVTAATRMDAIANGQIDLECGSTTSNVERQKRVGFSPTIFVSGTKLMVKNGAPVRSFRDLKGKKVVVTAGTTNEKTMRDLNEKFGVGMDIVVSRDHAESFALLSKGQADAFATDDVLLYGLLAQNAAKAEYTVLGDFLSYDPYGIMYRKGDEPLARVVKDAFQVLAEDGEIDRQYKRWFMRRLPSGASMDLPMSPQLEPIIHTMAMKAE